MTEPLRLLRAVFYAPLILFVIMGSYVFAERPLNEDRYRSADSRD